MPRPPLLPTIDWPAVFERGREAEAWLAAGENAGHVATMRALTVSLPVEPAIEQRVRALTRSVHVVAIAEDWCADVVRHAPVLLCLAALTPRLRVRFITRQDRLDVFERFLTNGGEAIPQFIFLSESWVETGRWGPMPAACREVIARGKACGDGKTAREIVNRQYAADPDCRAVFEELAHLIDIAATQTLKD